MTPTPYPQHFSSAHGRARVVKILLGAGAVVAALAVIAEGISFTLPPLVEDQELNSPAAIAVNLLMVFLGLLQVLVYVGTAVAFLIWHYRAYSNLKAFNPAGGLDHSPGWAVGFFFIPFVNLVMPYRTVREVWQKSGEPSAMFLQLPDPPALFPVWWTFWLLASFASRISSRLSFSEDVDQNTLAIVAVVANGLAILAAVFAYMVVQAIDERQEETSQKLGLGRYPAPPPPPASLSIQNEINPM